MTRTLVIVVDIAILCTFIESVGEMFLQIKFFGRSRRRRSHSRSKSRSSRRFRTSCEEHSYGGHGHSKRYDDRDNYHEGRRKRNKVQVLAIREDEVEALEEKGIVAQSVRHGGEMC
ncbi:hypothetical protein Golax_016398 [Gossypium laxum]|uniref:Uncharacterized protein n=1 Tax=Gossypium laxum TaxID=34288 RepID=A0A7J8YX69_9ROSI|nr:hypothetical protein [Gossypium laxum]